MKIEEDGKMLNVSKSLSFWFWDWETGDNEDKKNIFVVDSSGSAQNIKLDDIPILITWLQGLEKFRIKEPCKHEPKVFWCVDAYACSMNCKHCGVELQATWSEKKL